MKYWPGSATWSVRPTQCQTSRKNVRSSRSYSSRDVYQSFGSVPERSTPRSSHTDTGPSIAVTTDLLAFADATIVAHVMRRCKPLMLRNA